METENKTFAKCRAPLRQVKPLTFLSNHTHCLYHDDISQRSEGGVMLLRTSVWKTVNSNVLLPLAYISPSYIREEQRTLAAIQFMKPVQRPSWQKFPPLPYIRIFSSSSFSLPPNAKRVSPPLKFTFLLSLPVRPSVRPFFCSLPRLNTFLLSLLRLFHPFRSGTFGFAHSVVRSRPTTTLKFFDSIL